MPPLGHGAVRYRCPALASGPAIAPEGSTPVKGALAAKRSGELADCRFAAGRNVTWQGAGRYAAIALDRGAVEGGRRRVLRIRSSCTGLPLCAISHKGVFLSCVFCFQLKRLSCSRLFVRVSLLGRVTVLSSALLFILVYVRLSFVLLTWVTSTPGTGLLVSGLRCSVRVAIGARSLLTRLPARPSLIWCTLTGRGGSRWPVSRRCWLPGVISVCLPVRCVTSFSATVSGLTLTFSVLPIHSDTRLPLAWPGVLPCRWSRLRWVINGLALLRSTPTPLRFSWLRVFSAWLTVSPVLPPRRAVCHRFGSFAPSGWRGRAAKPATQAFVLARWFVTTRAFSPDP